MKPHPVSGIKQFLGLGLVMLNLDSVAKTPQLIGGQGGNKSFKKLYLSINRGWKLLLYVPGVAGLPDMVM